MSIGPADPVVRLQRQVVAYKAQIASGLLAEVALDAAGYRFADAVKSAIGSVAQRTPRLPDSDKPNPVLLHQQVLILGELAGIWQIAVIDGQPAWIETVFVRDAIIIAAEALRLLGETSVARMLGQATFPPQHSVGRRATVRRRQRLRRADGKSLGRGPSPKVVARVNNLVSYYRSVSLPGSNETHTEATAHARALVHKRGAAGEMLRRHMEEYGVSLPVAQRDWRLARAALKEKGWLGP